MSDQRFREKYGRRPYAWDEQGNVLRYEEYTDEEARDRYLKQNGAMLFVSGMFGIPAAFGTGEARKSFRSGYSGDFADRLALIKNLDPRLDPDLKKAWLNNQSTYDGQLHQAATKAVAENIPQDADNYVKPDLSKAGEYKKALDAYNKSEFTTDLTSLATVTPGPASSRFGATPEEISQSNNTNPRTGQQGGREAKMLWANDGELQYVYAGGDAQNPSVHFSGAELKPEEKGRYLYTGEALQEAEDGNRTTWGRKSNASSSDVMFGSETRKVGGLTTAADVFEDLKRRGITPPMRGDMGGQSYLRALSEQLARATDQTPYEAMENLASPHPLMGNPGREVGNIPETLEFRFADATDDQLARVGLSKNGIFEPNTDPFDSRHLPITGQVPSDLHIQLKDVPPSAIRRSFARPMAGAIAGATQSEDIARDLRNGEFGEAAFRTALSAGVGEIVGQTTNHGLRKLAEKGITQPATAMAGAGQLLGPPAAAIGSLDALSTLATGKNTRELAVEKGNTNAHLAASMAPMTGAPLGFAGSTVQATVPKNEERYAKAKELEANREAAIKRGGRWRLAGFEVPEFGLSEVFGLN